MIAARVADETRAVLTASERKQFSRARTFNADAYDAYSKGRVLWNKRTEDGMIKAIGEFRHATEIDPNYALVSGGQRPRTSRTFAARPTGVNGFWRYATPRSTIPRWTTTLSV